MRASTAKQISFGTLSLLVAVVSCSVASEDEPVAGSEDVDSTAQALTTYEVGPGRAYPNLQAVAGLLLPGDLVNVYGNATYPGDVNLTAAGTAANKITIRGVRVNGLRPVLSGGDNTLHVNGDHVVIEGLEIKGGARRCVFHHAHDVTIRDTVVHDCPLQGILGADEDSGSLLLDRVEVHHCGSGDRNHQIYMATDETAHPGSVFRMQNCFVHDANGGNDVKSRAERNEIYYNWLEGAFYRELELIGPDGQDDFLAREDSDVVGNVIAHGSDYYTVRIGGDTAGRYRFVNNTFLLRAATRAVFQLFDTVDSLEMHNNVFMAASGSVNVLNTDEVSWVNGRAISGARNWIISGASNVPPEWTGTLTGAAPGFANMNVGNLSPAAGSPLINAGISVTVSPAGHPFPNPLLLPTGIPPVRALPASATARPVNGAIDIGGTNSEVVAPRPTRGCPTPVAR